MPNVEFGTPLSERARKCAELIRNTILYTPTKDLVWQQDKEFFPEFAQKIEVIRAGISKRRRWGATITHALSEDSVLQEITKLSGFKDPIAIDILINRIYPDDFPNALDPKQRKAIKKEVDLMVSEAGDMLKNKEGYEFLSLLFISDLRLAPKKPNNINPHTQLSFGMEKE